MVLATNLGCPRIGPKRELKKALEQYWAGTIGEEELWPVGESLRRQNWELQRDLGLAHIPANDFSWYDHVLDTAALVGAVPSRYRWTGTWLNPVTYFAMARGRQDRSGNGDALDVPAMEMTKWFDTNYHYIVPEFHPDTDFRIGFLKPIEEYEEAARLGIQTRPVLLGPVSFLLLGKTHAADFKALDLLPKLLPVYAKVLRLLWAVGAEWVQIDEPCLVLDLDPAAKQAYRTAYRALRDAAPGLKLLLATYFGDLEDNLDLALSLPLDALHLDLVRGPGQLDRALDKVHASMSLSLGVVDGRNVWRTDLDAAIATVQKAVQALGTDRVMVGPSCSLLTSPVDLDSEEQLDPELKSWLAFAKQKLQEIQLIARAVNEGESAVADELAASRAAIAARKASPRIHRPEVKAREAAVTEADLTRQAPYATRAQAQRERLHLPLFPTTTIGSFPQTKDIRAQRAAFKSGKLEQAAYEAFLKEQIAECVRIQESLGLDVFVHGEAERTDMVEYFGELLDGVAITSNGWVQSYGSRCVRPPIIYGDITRPEAMTVPWSVYAQSLTSKPMKGMLTGPVTILQWAFVRDDQPRAATCRQLALAIRDEVVDLEKAGISVIQIDEPAIREGLPLRRHAWGEYLQWAIDAFRLAAAGVRNETQIHTHMCYSEFNDMIDSIARMDADVISMETSRSQMELLDAFATFQYPNEIGPGVYDIHSPRVPAEGEMSALLARALEVLSPQQLWVNPDCGLKTRRWDEVLPALEHMVAAARSLRAKVGEAVAV